MATFKAILIEKADGGQKVGLVDFDEAQLMEGDIRNSSRATRSC
jgi:acrylyl-CoA reductase (NADPH)